MALNSVDMYGAVMCVLKNSKKTNNLVSRIILYNLLMEYLLWFVFGFEVVHRGSPCLIEMISQSIPGDSLLSVEGLD